MSKITIHDNMGTELIVDDSTIGLMKVRKNISLNPVDMEYATFYKVINLYTDNVIADITEEEYNSLMGVM